MKCISCRNETRYGRIVCQSCGSVDYYRDYLTFHKCSSFEQIKDAQEGLCQNFLSCEPIKKALKKGVFIIKNLGHIVCPYPINISQVIYGKFTKDELEPKYKECLD